MGFVCSKVPALDENVLMVGLDSAGKTTILNLLKRQEENGKFTAVELEPTIPTIGFNVETVRFKGMSMTLWDIGGQDRLRSLWKHYYHSCTGVVFVIDANDRERLLSEQGVCHWIQHLAGQPNLHGAPFLLLANKQDMPDVASIPSLMDDLNLCKIFRGRQWHIQPTVATKGIGINEGFDWLAKALIKKTKLSNVN